MRIGDPHYLSALPGPALAGAVCDAHRVRRLEVQIIAMTGGAILLVVDNLFVGGTERQIVTLLKWLQRNGRFRVVLARLDHGGDFEAEATVAAADVLPLSRRGRFDWTPAVRLAWQARRAGIRLIHAVGWMSALAGLGAARCLGVPIVNGSIRSAPQPLGLRDRVGGWAARRSDWIVANSHAALAAHGLAGHPRTQVIANGVDLERFRAVTPDGPSDAGLCMVANFHAGKDHATPIRALRIIRRTFPSARLTLVGRDMGTLSASRLLARSLGVGDAVHFVSDTVHPEAFIAGSAVCILTSPAESFSNAVLEYLALGKPVVATTTCGDTAALVRDSGAGVLVPPDSPDVVAEHILHLLADPARARRMGQAGRAAVETLTAKRMAAQYEQVYERLLGNSPASLHPARGMDQRCAS